MSLCAYKDALGVPGQGVHSYRIFNVAVVDVALTFVLAYFVSWLFDTTYLLAVLMSFGAGIFLHWLFCVKTTINKLLFKV